MGAGMGALAADRYLLRVGPIASGNRLPSWLWLRLQWGPGRVGCAFGTLLHTLYVRRTFQVPFPRPRTKDPYKAAMQVIRQHLQEDPEPPRKRNPQAQISARLERVAMYALKKKLTDRYPTAKEMGQALGFKERAQGAAQGAAPVRSAPARRATTSLLVLQGPRKGQRIPLSSQVLTLGRLNLGSSNTTVSRRHANILFRGDNHWLQDTSKNGTWVDNQRVYGEVPLQTSAMIVIGDSVLRLEQSS